MDTSATEMPQDDTMKAVHERLGPKLKDAQDQLSNINEKVKGFTEGVMPVLNHISNEDITRLWRWLHMIHAASTR